MQKQLVLHGAIILLMGALLWTSLQTPVKGKVSGYTAMIADVSGLIKGADVRMAGTPVGKVTGVAQLDDAAAARSRGGASPPRPSARCWTPPIRGRECCGRRSAGSACRTP